MSSIRGREVFEVRDDRIDAVWLTWDWSEVYASLGATFRPADAAGEGRAYQPFEPGPPLKGPTIRDVIQPP